MSDSTTHLDTIATASAQKEIKVNEVADALSPSSAFGRRASTVSGLTWGGYGIGRWYINATATVKANWTLAITASATRYLSVNRALAASQVATAFDVDKLALDKIVTGAASHTSYEDHRDPHHINRFLYGRFTLAMADANKTLNYEQAMCESMELTGALTALRDVVVPLIPRDWKVFANTTGGYGIRVLGASGNIVHVPDGACAIVECDGTNLLLVSCQPHVNTTAVGNVGTGEDDLIAFTIPAGAIYAAKKGVRITAWGTTANNANTKTLKLYFGSLAILTTTLTISQAGTWRIDADVFSTGTDAQDYSARLAEGGATTQTDVEGGSHTQDDGAAIVIKCTGDATANDDIKQEGLIVQYVC
jgi:hypothetical protein